MGLQAPPRSRRTSAAAGRYGEPDRAALRAACAAEALAGAGLERSSHSRGGRHHVEERGPHSGHRYTWPLKVTFVWRPGVIPL
jgi:hypothetical protein